MELIFFYITESETGFIQKTGFNFSSRYKFSVEDINGKCRLKAEDCEAVLPDNFFDKDGCVTNVTAIVGANGSGKTTLLKELLNTSGESRVLSIYLDDTQLKCYHNIHDLEIHTDLLHKSNIYVSEPEKISQVYISNSVYGEYTDFSASETGEVKKLALNMDSLQILKSRFYRRNTGRIVGGSYEIPVVIASTKSMMEFQHILDILYLNSFSSEERDSVLGKDVGNILDISFDGIGKYLNTYYRGMYVDENNPPFLQKCYNNMVQNILKIDSLKSEEKFTSEFTSETGEAIVNLYINLLYEVLAALNITSNNENFSVKDEEELQKLIQKLLKDIPGSAEKKRLIDSLKEIDRYKNILKSAEKRNGILPYYRIENKKDIVYKEFMKLIKDSVFQQEDSFILKYINISGINLASGERALLNFFSWLYFAPVFNQIIGNKKEKKEESLQENILLLIDELDLYCHPLWQQKMLTFLIEELTRQYSNKKVQIIFTTHSPIVLSDIPRCNIIFLEKCEGRCHIDDSFLHEETFGANIYKLYNDAFFLKKKGQIGEFAKRKIEEIIKEICPRQLPESGAKYSEIPKVKADCLEKEIALIGEPLIRNKLYDMLYKCQDNSMYFIDRKLKYYEKKAKEIREKRNHDTH